MDKNNLIPAMTGAAFILREGESLEVCDPEGEQVSDLFCAKLADPADYFSAGRTWDYADKVLISKGDILYSHRSTPLMRITADTCGRHDLLMPPCSLKMFQIVAGNSEYHPSCHENLCKNLQEFGLTPDMIHSTFNIFMNVGVKDAGKLVIGAPESKSGDSITFVALTDLVVGLTACSHEETNAGRCKPVRYIKH